MNLETTSYRSGERVIPDGLREKTIHAIESIEFPISKGCSTSLRDRINDALFHKGWSKQVELSAKRKITITSMQKKVGLCLQLDNMARFYADLIKLQTLYIDGKIIAGIYIIPTKSAAKVIGSNIANSERMIAELEIFKRIVTVPLYVIGLDK